MPRRGGSRHRFGSSEAGLAFQDYVKHDDNHSSSSNDSRNHNGNTNLETAIQIIMERPQFGSTANIRAFVVYPRSGIVGYSSSFVSWACFQRNRSSMTCFKRRAAFAANAEASTSDSKALCSSLSAHIQSLGLSLHWVSDVL